MKEMLSSHLYEINNNKMKMFKRKSFMVFQNSRLISCYKVTQMANYQTSSEGTTSSHAQTGLAWPLSNKTQMRTAQEIADDLSVF